MISFSSSIDMALLGAISTAATADRSARGAEGADVEVIVNELPKDTLVSRTDLVPA